jgi:hypothetical protein
MLLEEPMIAPVLLWLASRLLAVVTAVTRPSSATCPPRWWLSHGVTADGRYTCSAPVGPEEWPPINAASPPSFEGRIYCSSDERAVQVGDGRSVRCAREGARS